MSQEPSAKNTLTHPSSPQTQSPGFWSIFLKATLLSLLIVLVMLIVTALGLGWYGYQKLQTFSQESGMSLTELKNLAQTAWKLPPTQTNGHQNLLILGLDSLETRGDSPPLTDTILVASINFDRAQVMTLPLPRDLWNPEYQTKINALYYYGSERSPDSPEQFPTKVISQTLGIPIHFTLVVTLEQLAEIIDLAGGITIDVKDGFTDNLFPRPDVDVNQEHDPAKLYKSVTFATGTQSMSGQTALEYIRSRKAEGDQGSDLARSKRQQQVIEALLAKLMSKDLLLNPNSLGKIVNYYNTYFQDHLPLLELAATAKSLLMADQELKLSNAQLSIYPDDPDGILEVPPKNRQYLYQDQWVFLIRDPAGLPSKINDLLK